MATLEQSFSLPAPVTYEELGPLTTVLIRTNIEKHEETYDEHTMVYYTDMLTRMIVDTNSLTSEVRAEIESDPAKYLQKIEVEDERPKVEDKVQAWVDKAVTTRATTICDAIPNGIVFDTQACINAMGLEPGDMFIDAKNGIHILTDELISNIKAALKKHVSSLYAQATIWRERIKNATTSEELDNVSKEIDEH